MSRGVDLPVRSVSYTHLVDKQLTREESKSFGVNLLWQNPYIEEIRELSRSGNLDFNKDVYKRQPTYSISQDVWYRYKLEGLDHEWIVSQGPKKLYYTKLPPGKYTLRVQASRESGTWTGEASSLAIIVKPPFWSMPFAYFLYVLIIFTTFTWFFIRYRRKLKEKERHQIEMLQNEKYKEMCIRDRSGEVILY